ncbi:double-strand break repair helicase AddA [Rhodobacter sp. KR11]|uniref:double-strand break repair helicase AddA n=1 Tax=Rhodobacter sp. KR11 TaxID=2974588 RepID=UPI002221A397|nr:double-strand break repair helicase AddA [Rhodobacter sp. KR11]MCW1918883.1 double-strand break repair helicase AddA [Rhodobacter sp. KR11]
MIPLEALSAQRKAADPLASTWLSANAGSGKTRVLTDRVARLLLGGVSPQRILCLTYTKAAATEMQNRLFARLGEWAMMEDAKLTAALSDLGETGLGGDTLARARRLFARAIETPGGLRIQTIHSFCASLLRRFPLEAGVSPGFAEMDDRAAKMLRADLLEEMATQVPAPLSQAARYFSGDGFPGLLADIAGYPDGFDGTPFAPDSAADLLAEVFLGDESDLLAAVLPILAAGSANDVKAAENLTRVTPSLEGLQALEGVLLTGSSAKEPFTAKLGSFPTKATQGKLGTLLPRLEDLMRRVEAARPRRLALYAAEKTAALAGLARAFLPRWQARKSALGVLDFDDLITRARDLLSDPSVAAWVLFRLDGGIDHVLVDEAQDTSPDQWRVVELLTAEFTAGAGTREGGRTLFVVGDKKQSIYSFQGADVAAFDEKQALFQRNFDAVAQVFQVLPLEYSFRSSPAILDVVDAALSGRDPGALGDTVSHRATNEALPGRVDLWPLIADDETPEDTAFEDPVDLIRDSHPVARLSAQIAENIAAMLARGEQIPTAKGPRPMTPGDVLILVQTRGPVFDEVIRACKARGLPIAGADRLELTEELAVKDLIALLKFLATPEDDLSLASVLRSPMFGITEAELYAITRRKGFLWEAIRAKDTPYVTALHDLRDRVDFLRPYELLQRALIRHDGRRRLLARLGHEAEDAIDELLNLALTYEAGSVPSLTGFLSWLEQDEAQVKRQAEGAGGRIRVMTVHGSKGLEAEVVFLPQTNDRRANDRGAMLEDDQGRVYAKVPADAAPPEILALIQRKQAREAEENLRLLYVALTRARSWLVVCGAGEAKSEKAWHGIVAQGMAKLPAQKVPFGLRHQHGDWPDPVPPEAQPQEAPAPLEAWVFVRAEPMERQAKTLSPSDLGGAKALAGGGEDSETAMARGTALHKLLQFLPDHPVETWPAVAKGLWAEAQLEAAARLILDPNLAEVFAGQAEVALTADWNGRRLMGSIDRLVALATGGRLIVDFKSNLVVPSAPDQVPEGILRQMGAYRHMVGGLGIAADCAILWTETGRLMTLPRDLVDAALARAIHDLPALPLTPDVVDLDALTPAS